MVLFARFTAEKVLVLFDPDGGSVSPSQKQVDYNGSMAEIPMPSREGYRFAGWFTFKDGEGEELTYDTKITSSRTYYACWRSWIARVEYYGNGGYLT